MIILLIREENRHTGRMPCDDRGKYWNDIFTSQVMPKIAGHGQKLGSSKERFHPESQRNHAMLMS